MAHYIATATPATDLVTSYMVPSPNYELHLTSMECTLFHVVREAGLPKTQLGIRTYEQWHLPRLAAEYLRRCDGERTHGEICADISVPFRMIQIGRAHV